MSEESDKSIIIPGKKTSTKCEIKTYMHTITLKDLEKCILISKQAFTICFWNFFKLFFYQVCIDYHNVYNSAATWYVTGTLKAVAGWID